MSPNMNFVMFAAFWILVFATIISAESETNSVKENDNSEMAKVLQFLTANRMLAENAFGKNILDLARIQQES